VDLRAQRPAIVAHGGAGEWRQERQRAGVLGVKAAVQAGFETLKGGGSALDAVESAVMLMEDNDVFNAGLGASLALNGRVEMEASIMDGETLSAGAVGLMHDIKHPVRLARIVMENTDHVFIVGQGAEKLAQLFKLERRDSSTRLRERYWLELKDKLTQGKLGYLSKLSKILRGHPSLFDLDTVGAVAVDKSGTVASATSTGGTSLKIPGRIGDSPLIGCGNYADNESGACSATGIGEIAIKLVLAKSTCDRMRDGESPQSATEALIREVNRRIRDADNQMGLIAVDTRGRVGAAHNSRHMCWGCMTPQTKRPRGSLTARIVKNAV
jgi:beta-aspartyl-peptidase (threonine type)